MKGINAPEAGHVFSYYEELKASGRKPNTVYSYIAAVRAFFRWAQAKGLYCDISADLPIPKIEHVPTRKTLTALQLKKVLDSIDRETLQGMRDYAIITLMLTGGLSAREISAANIGDVCESVDGYVLHVHDSNGEKHETISVPSHVMEAISQYLDARERDRKSYSIKPDMPLFLSISDRNRDKNQHMSVGSITRIVKETFRQAGYDDALLSAQSLKISAMKLALQHGERLEDVQKFARHKQIRTTFLYEQKQTDITS